MFVEKPKGRLLYAFNTTKKVANMHKVSFALNSCSLWNIDMSVFFLIYAGVRLNYENRTIFFLFKCYFLKTILFWKDFLIEGHFELISSTIKLTIWSTMFFSYFVQTRQVTWNESFWWESKEIKYFSMHFQCLE